MIILNQKTLEIYIIKSLAILSVVSAHCYVLPHGQNGFPQYCALFLRNFGTVGVLCFFIMAGYLYHPEKYTARQLIITKAKTVVLPWVVAGLCTIIVNGYKPFIAITFILGYRSMLYFLPMLMICFLFFYIPIMRRKHICIAMIIVTLASTTWFYDIFYQVLLSPFGIDPEEWRGYLNPLNWLGYFAFGVLTQTEIKCWRKYLYNRWTGMIACVVFILSSAYQLTIGSSGSYFYGGGCLLIRVSGVILILFAANLITRKTDKRKGFITKAFIEIGKDSYSIYLWHSLSIYYVVVLFNSPILINCVIMRPLVIVSVVAGVDMMIRKISKYKHSKFLLTVFGLR